MTICRLAAAEASLKTYNKCLFRSTAPQTPTTSRAGHRVAHAPTGRFGSAYGRSQPSTSRSPRSFAPRAEACSGLLGPTPASASRCPPTSCVWGTSRRFSRPSGILPNDERHCCRYGVLEGRRSADPLRVLAEYQGAGRFDDPERLIAVLYGAPTLRTCLLEFLLPWKGAPGAGAVLGAIPEPTDEEEAVDAARDRALAIASRRVPPMLYERVAVHVRADPTLALLDLHSVAVRERLALAPAVAHELALLGLRAARSRSVACARSAR
jgi:hypothetical protein